MKKKKRRERKNKELILQVTATHNRLVSCRRTVKHRKLPILTNAGAVGVPSVGGVVLPLSPLFSTAPSPYRSSLFSGLFGKRPRVPAHIAHDSTSLLLLYKVKQKYTDIPVCMFYYSSKLSFIYGSNKLNKKLMLPSRILEVTCDFTARRTCAIDVDSSAASAVPAKTKANDV